MNDPLQNGQLLPAAVSRGASSCKFSDPHWTSHGEPRAVVVPTVFKTLWFNTGTLCNLTCAGCYIESSPRNDRLVYLSHEEVSAFLNEALHHYPSIEEVGFTGGEPFMNPDIAEMLQTTLCAGYRALVLTNAMLPMRRHRSSLLELHARYAEKLSFRISLDHYSQEIHERVRGRHSWEPAMEGLKWLSDHGFDIAIAARNPNQETDQSLRRGFYNLTSEKKISIDAWNPHQLVLFPEIDETCDVPEISENCWNVLGKNPSDVMCATSRMVIKRNGDDRPRVVSCTLLPYDEQFEMGRSLVEANRPVQLNHPHCAKFCVLGGASCSS